MAWHARWSATRDDEQAQSMANDGPVKLKIYDTLLAAILIANPAPVQ